MVFVVLGIDCDDIAEIVTVCETLTLAETEVRRIKKLDRKHRVAYEQAYGKATKLYCFFKNKRKFTNTLREHYLAFGGPFKWNSTPYGYDSYKIKCFEVKRKVPSNPP